MGSMSPAIIAIIVLSVVVVLIVIAVIIWCYCRRGNYRSKEDQYKSVQLDDEVTAPKRDEEEGFRAPTQKPEDKHIYPQLPELDDGSIISKQEQNIHIPVSHLTSLAEEDEISNKDEPVEIPLAKQEHQARETPKISSKDINTLFYFNQMQSAPNGDYVDDIHGNWWSDYDKLEHHHGYIQWLFPIVGEQGLNPQAKELQPHEAQAIIQDARARLRVLKSYRLMLDFYGMRMPDEQTGIIERGLNWDDRFYHLNHSHHNYLRITRILKSLGYLGFQHLQAPLVEFFISEIVENKTLSNCAQSCKNFWIKAVKDDEARDRLEKMLP